MKALVFILILGLPFGVFSESKSTEEAKEAVCTKLCDYEFMEEATPEEVQKLIDEGHDVNGRESIVFERRPLHFARTPEVLQVLIDNGADIEGRAFYERTPLQSHSKKFPVNIDMIKVLLENGADPNAKDEGWQTPAHIITSGIRGEGSLRALGLLLFYGADIDTEDKEGKSVRDYLIDFNWPIMLLPYERS